VFLLDDSPEKAKFDKSNLRLALAVRVTDPVILSSTDDGPDATMDDPFNYTETVSILFVEPKCAILMNQAGLALQTVDTGPIK